MLKAHFCCQAARQSMQIPGSHWQTPEEAEIYVAAAS